MSTFREPSSMLRSRTLELDWGRMRVWEEGEGPTLLAIHGVGGSGRYFRDLSSRLATRYRVIAPDMAGFGASDKPDLAYDRDFHMGNIDAVLAGTDGPVTLLGHSLGGCFAALWAARNPGRVAALAIAAAPFPWADGSQEWMRDGAAPPRRRGAVRALKLLVPLLALPIGVAQGFPAGVSLDYGRQRFGPRVRTLWWSLHDPGVLADLEGLRGLDAPALLAFAEGDRSVPPSTLERWAVLLPSAERRLLDGGDHQFLLREGGATVAEWLEHRAGVP